MEFYVNTFFKLETISIIILLYVILMIASIKHLSSYLLPRTVTFILLLLLILNPYTNKEKETYKENTVFIVSDYSFSILEGNKINEVKIISEYFEKELINFSNTNIENIKIKNSSYKDGTLIFQELSKIISRADNKVISGIIIITDGQIQDKKEFLNLPKDIPLHFILVGKKNEYDRVLITETMQEYVLVGQKIDLGIYIEDQQNNNKIATQILLDGKLFLSKELLPNIIHNIKIPIKHVGENYIEVKISNARNELSTKNNYRLHKVNAVHDKLRVMLISGEPNMGLRNLRNILNSDPSIELLHFTILRPPSKRDSTPADELSLIPFPTQELFAADISKFSLIIFDSYALNGILPPKYLNNIATFVKNGGALLDISGGSFSKRILPSSTPIKQILPSFNKMEKQIGSFIPKLTELGERHPITNNIKENYQKKEWGKWNSFNKSERLSGVTLMEHNGFPLMIVSKVENGRVAQILTDQTWIWKKSQADKGPFIKLLRNTIQWLLKTPEFDVNHIQYKKEDDLITFEVNSLTAKNIQANIVYPSGKKKTITLKNNKKGYLKGKFSSDEIGKHSIKIGKIKKYIYPEINDVLEIIDIRSTEEKIRAIQEMQTFKSSIFWHYEKLPKIVKIYNNKVLYGKNWIGILEKKVLKEKSLNKENFIKWYYLAILILFFLFYSWYREGKR